VELLASGVRDNTGAAAANEEIGVNLEILPPAQRALWPELKRLPPHWVLYGGTAIALRLGHRQSVDFDFFSHLHLRVDELPFTSEAEVLQRAPDTLTVSVMRAGGPVKLSFFGGLSMGRVGEPERASDNGLAVASLLDLAATKMKVVQERAESRDYLDVFALLRHGIRLEQALGAAQTLYGVPFNPAITLKALAYFQDGDLPSLPAFVRSVLVEAATQVGSLPHVPRVSDNLI